MTPSRRKSHAEVVLLERGITMRLPDLARAVRVSKSSITKIFNGQREASVETLRRIAMALGMTLTEADAVIRSAASESGSKSPAIELGPSPDRPE